MVLVSTAIDDCCSSGRCASACRHPFVERQHRVSGRRRRSWLQCRGPDRRAAIVADQHFERVLRPRQLRLRSRDTLLNGGDLRLRLDDVDRCADALIHEPLVAGDLLLREAQSFKLHRRFWSAKTRSA